MKDLVGQRIGSIRVDSFLGAGGMGEVYAGFDEKLERPVALKAIRGPFRMTRWVKERFLREARILSRLDHPGICRIHDLVEHEDWDLLVLELIDGRTLASFRDEGDLGPDEKLRIALRLTEILAAAHEERIVHRDLKPENVMITEKGDVKVLDFGISRSLDQPPRRRRPTSDPGTPEWDDDADTAETVAGAMLGTLRYMSPEQARGDEVRESSDIYTLGLLFQELFGESRAYPEDASPPTLVELVSSGATLPPEGVDPELAGLIARMEAAEPADRPTAGEVLERLESIRDRPRRRRRRLLQAALGFYLVGVLAVTWWLTSRRDLDHLAEPGTRVRVAILPFVDRAAPEEDGAEASWTATGLPELVARQLGAADGVEVLPLGRTRRAEVSVERPEDPSLDRIRRRLAADVAVRGEIFREDDSRLTVRWASASRAGRITVRSAEIERRIQGAEAVARDLGRRLGGRKVSSGEVFGTRDPFLLQAYAVGVHLLATVGAVEAKPHFEVCVIGDPGFQLARLRLANAEEKLGNWERSLELGEEVLAAAEALRNEDLESDALQFLGSLLSARGEAERARDLLVRGLELVRRIGDRTEESRALYSLGRLHFDRGAWDEAAARFEEALEVALETGDRSGELDALNFLGLVAWHRGDLEEATERFEAVLDRAATSGDPRRRGHALVNLGNVAEDMGEKDRAEQLWTEALDLLMKIGDRRNELVVRNNLGVLALQREEWSEAEGLYRELIDRSVELGDAAAEAAARLNLAEALIESERPDEATEHLDRLLAIDSWVRDHAQTWLLRAQQAYDLGRLDDAVRLLEGAKEAAGDGWEPEDEELLELYRRAEGLGRRLPVPQTGEDRAEAA